MRRSGSGEARADSRSARPGSFFLCRGGQVQQYAAPHGGRRGEGADHKAVSHPGGHGGGQPELGEAGLAGQQLRPVEEHAPAGQGGGAVVEAELGSVPDRKGGISQQSQMHIRPVGEDHGAGSGQGVPLFDGTGVPGEQQGGPVSGLQPLRANAVALELPHPHRPRPGVQRRHVAGGYLSGGHSACRHRPPAGEREAPVHLQPEGEVNPPPAGRQGGDGPAQGVQPQPGFGRDGEDGRAVQEGARR